MGLVSEESCRKHNTRNWMWQQRPVGERIVTVGSARPSPMEASHNNHRPHIQWEKMQCNVYNALTCDSGTSGLFLAASHSTCFVRFRDIPSSSGMWLWSVERRTVGGSVKSVCARPGQPGTVHRQCCLAGYLRSFRKEYPLRRRFVPLPDLTNSALTFAIARIRLVNDHVK